MLRRARRRRRACALERARTVPVPSEAVSETSDAPADATFASFPFRRRARPTFPTATRSSGGGRKCRGRGRRRRGMQTERGRDRAGLWELLGTCKPADRSMTPARSAELRSCCDLALRATPQRPRGRVEPHPRRARAQAAWVAISWARGSRPAAAKGAGRLATGGRLPGPQFRCANCPSFGTGVHVGVGLVERVENTSGSSGVISPVASRRRDVTFPRSTPSTTSPAATKRGESSHLHGPWRCFWLILRGRSPPSARICAVSSRASSFSERTTVRAV